MKVQQIKINDIKPYPKNNKKHSDHQIRLVANSIRDFGMNQPIVVDSNNVCIVGHARIEACKLLNIAEIPSIKKDDLTPDQIRAYRIADNKLSDLGEYDLDNLEFEVVDLLANGFDLAEYGLDALLPEIDPEVIEDEAPEPPINPVTELGDIWLLGNHRVLCGDSTLESSYIDLMQGKKADMVFTDPPYGISVVKNGKVGADFGVAKKGEYIPVASDESTEVAKLFYGVCKSLGFDSFIIWGGNYFTDFLDKSDGLIVWDKRCDTGIKNTFADGEVAYCSFHTPVRIYKQLWNGMIREGEKDKRLHPTQKPLRVLSDIIKNHIKGDLVADPFLGSGSTLIACEQLDRICYGIELEPKYCDVIVNRWQNLTDKEAIHEKTGKTYQELKDGKGL